MKSIDNWNDVKEAGGGFETLPAGGYVCSIMRCEEKENRRGKGSHLEIIFDIAEGEYSGFFANDYKEQEREDKFWRGIFNQNIPDENSNKYEIQCQFFKKFTNALEASNAGYHWDWDETKLKGKIIGVLFGEIERESTRGTRYMITRADSVLGADKVREGKYKIPASKRLSPAQNTVDFVNISTDDKDLPF